MAFIVFAILLIAFIAMVTDTPRTFTDYELYGMSAEEYYEQESGHKWDEEDKEKTDGRTNDL